MCIVLNVSKIKKELTRQGLTQMWLAEKLGCTRQNVGYIMQKKPVKMAGKIGRILGFAAKDLICEE
jgi:transcriptional regulator